MTRFSAVVLDVDSTLSRIEGIEWQAFQCEVSVLGRIAVPTDAAMRGDIPLEAVYGERLRLVRSYGPLLVRVESQPPSPGSAQLSICDGPTTRFG